MPITPGNASDLGNNGGSFASDEPRDPIVGPRAAVLSAPHTLADTSNALFVGIEGAFPPVDDITSVRVGEVPLIELARFVDIPGRRNNYVYVAIDPPTGPQNITIESAGDHYLAGLACDYGGASVENFTLENNLSPIISDELTTTIEVLNPNSWVLVFEGGYTDNNAAPQSDDLALRTYAHEWGTPGFFDSGAAVPAGDFTFTTIRPLNLVPSIHLAVAFGPLTAEPPPGIAFNHAADLGNNSEASNELRANYRLGSGSDFLAIGFKGDIIAITGTAAPHTGGGSGRQPSTTQWDDIESVTYGGVPLDFIGKSTPPADYTPATYDRWAYFYCLHNPPIGDNEVVITATNQHSLEGIAADYIGVGRLTGGVGNFAVPGAPSLTTAVPIERDGSLVILLEAGYSTDDLPPTPVGGSCIRRAFRVGYADFALFDSGQTADAGDYDIATSRNIPGPDHTTIHLAIVVAPPSDITEPVAVDLDPAAHAPVTAAGNIGARVFPRPIGVRLDPVEHPRVEISSR